MTTSDEIVIKLHSGSIRSEIINKMIFGDLYKSTVYLVNKIVKKHVDFYNLSFECLICLKTYKGYNSIYRHIAVVHKNIVDRYLMEMNLMLEYGELQ